VFFGPACFVMLSMAWYFCLRRRGSPAASSCCLLVLNVPFTVAGIFAIHRAAGATSTGLVKTIFAAAHPAAADLPAPGRPDRAGAVRRAADYFRDHVRIEPGDHEARLQLAHLLETRLQGDAEAEQFVSGSATHAARFAARDARGNGLIDLYGEPSDATGCG